MKNIYIITLSLLVYLLAFTGCDDFLKEEPKSQHSSNNPFDDLESLNQLSLGVYKAYYQIYTSTSYDFWAGQASLGIAGTDEVIVNPGAGGAASLYKHNYTSEDTNGVFRAWYKYHYDVIARASNVIYFGENSKNKSEDVLRLVAEAKSMRAWAYFRLAQTFGPVPLVDRISGTVDYSTGRAPLRDIYEKIIKDLTEATTSKYMYEDNTAVSDHGRITHWAALTMLGKVYLTIASHKESGNVDELMSLCNKPEHGYKSIPGTVEEFYQLARQTLSPVLYESGIELHTNSPQAYGELFCTDKRNTIRENLWSVLSGDADATPNALKSGMRLFRMIGVAQEERLPIRNGAGVNRIMMYCGGMGLEGAPYYGYVRNDSRLLWNCSGSYRMYPKIKWGDGNRQPWDRTSVGGDSINNPDHPYYPVYTLLWDAAREHWNQEYGWTARSKEAIMQQITENDYLGQFAAITKWRYSSTDSISHPTKYTNFYDTPRAYPVLRFADAALMYAEACVKLEGSGSSEAIVWINKIRDRARGSWNVFDSYAGRIPNGKKVGDRLTVAEVPGLPDLTSVTMQDIMNERRWELFMEGHRWFDLARWGELVYRFNDCTPAPVGQFGHGEIIIDKKNYLYPIPSYERNQSNDLDAFFQNYGY